MEEEKKNKLKKILSYIGCGIGCFILGLCVSNCANNKGKKASNLNNNTQNEVVQNVEHKNIQFNDVDAEITFSSNDLNNYSYPNLASYISQNINVDDTYLEDFFMEYKGQTFGFYDLDKDEYFICEGVDIDTDFIYFFLGESFNWRLYDSNEAVYYSFADNESLVVLAGSHYYQGFKTAIQQDIEYNNQQYQQSIFGGLTESLVDFIGVFGSGFTSVFTIFYASGHITTFGTLSLIVVGVALAYFLFRFIIGLIRLRG